jgi:hypothetical protein
MQDVDAATGAREDSLVASFAFGAFAVVEGAADGVTKRAEERLIEDPLEGLVVCG